MVRRRKSRIIKVSSHHYDRSSENQLKYSSTRNKRPGTVIHARINFPKSFDSIHNNLYSILNKKRNISDTKNELSKHSFNISAQQENHQSFFESNKKIKKSDSLTKTSYLSSSSKVTPQENSVTEQTQSENDLSDRKGMTNDYHKKIKRNKKIKCSRRCFIISLIVTILLILIITAILLAVFIKPNTTMTTTSSTAPVLRWNTTGITIAGITGNPGNASNQLNSPFDARLDYDNNLYVVDRYNHRVQKYLSGSLIGQTVCGNGTYGFSSSQLYLPSRVIVDSNENLYIADTYGYRVQYWLKGATSGTTIAGTTGVFGNGSNQLNVPYGITLNSTSKTLYISDYSNQRIMSYASGVQNGTLVFGGIGGGTSNTQLYCPTGIYYDSFSDSLLIANILANNVVRYTLGATVWSLVAGDFGGSPGITSARLKYPIDMTLDPMGNLYVADRENHRIQFFLNGQSNGTTIAGITGVNSANATTLNWPWSVVLDRQLNLYVADALNHRVQKFLRY